MTAAVFGSVGAQVDDPTGDAWAAAVAAGEIHGVESSFAGMAGFDLAATPVMTASNIVLCPKMNVLVANRDAFEGLDEDQRALLRQAASDTLGAAGLVGTEAAAAEVFCAAGGRIVNASPAAVRELRQAMVRTAAPYEPAATLDLGRATGELVGDLPAAERVACP